MKKARLLSVLLPLAVLASFAGTGFSANAEPGFYTYNEEATGDPAIRQLVAEVHLRAMYEYCGIIEEAWIRNPANDHYYMLTEPMFWTGAEAWAQEWGGHLVTLRNWEEELWIKDTFGRDENFWIGFNDIEEEGEWVWASGEPVIYTNWHEFEPNNCGGPWPACYPEDVAIMNFGDCEVIDDSGSAITEIIGMTYLAGY